MPLPTCECVKGLPIGEQLAAIYCATYTLAAGDVDGPYLLKSANLSDVADPDVSRGNISAAESGANTDITSLGGVLDIGANGAAPSAATYPKVKARTASDQTLAIGSVTTLVFGTEMQDDGNIYNPSTGETTIGANAGGTYSIGIAGLFLTGGSADGLIFQLYVNGAEACTFKRINGSLDSFFIDSFGGEFQLSAGDVVTMRAFQNSGTGWVVTANATRNLFYLSRKF